MVTEHVVPTIAMQVLGASLRSRGIDYGFCCGEYVASSNPHKLRRDLAKAIDGFRPNVVGETVMAETFHSHLRLNQLLRAKYGDQLVIAAGGPALTSHLERAVLALDADVGFSGAGEEIFPAFLRNLGDRGSLVSLGNSLLSGVADPQSVLVIPDRAAWCYTDFAGKPAQPRGSLLKYYNLQSLGMSLYPDMLFPWVGTLQLIFDRGCRKHCTFCLEHRFLKGQMAEARDIYSFLLMMVGFIDGGGMRYRLVELDLWDSDFLQNLERNRQLDELLRGPDGERFEQTKNTLRVAFAYLSLPAFNADRGFNIEFMKRLGINTVNIGIDGIVPRTYRRFGKGGRFEDIDDTLACLIDAGFCVHMGVILSDQHTTEAELFEGGRHLLILAERYSESQLQFATSWAVDPYFGTPIADKTLMQPDNVGKTDDFPGYPLFPPEYPVLDKRAARRIKRFCAEVTRLNRQQLVHPRPDLFRPHVEAALREMLRND